MKIEITGQTRAEINRELRDTAIAYNRYHRRDAEKARAEMFDYFCGYLTAIGEALGGDEKSAGFTYAPYTDEIAEIYYHLGSKRISLKLKRGDSEDGKVAR